MRFWGVGGWQRSRIERRKKIKTGSCYTESGRNRRKMHLLMLSHVDASAVALSCKLCPRVSKSWSKKISMGCNWDALTRSLHSLSSSIFTRTVQVGPHQYWGHKFSLLLTPTRQKTPLGHQTDNTLKLKIDYHCLKCQMLQNFQTPYLGLLERGLRNLRAGFPASWS